MLIPKNTTTNSLPKMAGDTGYGLGFFCGCLVGAVGTYLAFTEEGQKLKTKIIKEFQANQQILTLESLRPSNTDKPESKTIESIRHLIARLRHKLSAFESPKPVLSSHSTGPKPKHKHYFKQK